MNTHGENIIMETRLYHLKEKAITNSVGCINVIINIEMEDITLYSIRL